jgi:hypothetical protein
MRHDKAEATPVQQMRRKRSLDATKPGSPAGSYAGVPTMFQWHTCVSRGSSTVSKRTLRFAEELA